MYLCSHISQCSKPSARGDYTLASIKFPVHLLNGALRDTDIRTLRVPEIRFLGSGRLVKGRLAVLEVDQEDLPVAHQDRTPSRVSGGRKP